MQARRVSRLAVVGVVVAATVGHLWYWYAPRWRQARPSALAAGILAADDPAPALWLAAPHQSLGALEHRVGDLDDLVAEVCEAMARPCPSLPRIGPWRLPPAHELLAVGTADSFRLGLRPLTAVRWIARAAGRLGANPWLAGGAVVVGGEPAEVCWRGGWWWLARGVSCAPGGSYATAMALPAAQAHLRADLRVLGVEERRVALRVTRRGMDVVGSAPAPALDPVVDGALLAGSAGLGAGPGIVLVVSDTREALPGVAVAGGADEVAAWLDAKSGGALSWHEGVKGELRVAATGTAALERAIGWLGAVPQPGRLAWVRPARLVDEAGSGLDGLGFLPLLGGAERRRLRAGTALLRRLDWVDVAVWQVGADGRSARLLIVGAR